MYKFQGIMYSLTVEMYKKHKMYKNKILSRNKILWCLKTVEGMSLIGYLFPTKLST